MEDLLTWSERWGTEAVVEIMVMLPDDYPKRPPEVRMLRPLLEVRARFRWPRPCLPAHDRPAPR